MKAIQRIVALLLILLHYRANTVAGGELTFLVVGDWGGEDDDPYYTDGEKRVADSMGEIGKQVGSQFTISVGDNFYDNGVKSVNDPRFKQTFEVSVCVYSRSRALLLDLYNRHTIIGCFRGGLVAIDVVRHLREPRSLR